MVDVTPEVIKDFRRFLKPFSDVTKFPDVVIEQTLIECDCWTGGKVWGDYDIDNDRNLKKRGWYYLTAHIIVSAYGTDASDPSNVSPEARLNVASKSVGDESVTYRVTEMEPTTNDFLSTSYYGVMFLSIRNRIKSTPMCV